MKKQTRQTYTPNARLEHYSRVYESAREVLEDFEILKIKEK